MENYLYGLTVQGIQPYIFSTCTDYGISANKPILMDSVFSTYAFLNKLKSLKNGIEYNRRGCIIVDGFENPIDVYEFTFAENYFCKLYAYSYHSRNLQKIPLPFIHLNLT